MATPATRHSLGDQFQGILTAAQDGGEWAVATLYRSLQPAVVGYLRARAGGDAEDLASETWLAVARALPTFSGDEAAFRSWVFTIAHRRLVDHHRAVARRPRTRSLTPAEGEEFAGAGDALPSGDDPAAEVVAAVAGDEAVRRIVALLPKDQADVLLLRVVAGLSVDDVARITGRRPGTVRVLQHRALRRLAERLGKAPAEL